MLGIDGTSLSRYFHTVTHYSVSVHQNQPLFIKFFRFSFTLRIHARTAIRYLLPLSRPEFLHKANPVVKIMTVEKVGKPAKRVGSFYVNHYWIP